MSYAATTDFFGPDKHAKGGLRLQCKECFRIYNRKYYKEHRTQIGKHLKRYYERHKTQVEKQKAKNRKTINGYLRCVYHSAKQRCNNPENRAYYRYGGRGIKMKFESLNVFRKYVIDILGYDSFDKIKGLQIDRTDNDGNYEKGNIRFVTAKVNSNNRRR